MEAGILGMLGKELRFYILLLHIVLTSSPNIHLKKWKLARKEIIFLSCRQLADLHKENASKDSAVQVSPFLKLSNNM